MASVLHASCTGRAGDAILLQPRLAPRHSRSKTACYALPRKPEDARARSLRASASSSLSMGFRSSNHNSFPQGCTAPELPVRHVQEAEKALLKTLLQLNIAVGAGGHKLKEAVKQRGMAVVASSATKAKGPINLATATDSFEDYDDAQAGSLTAVKRLEAKVSSFYSDEVGPRQNWQPVHDSAASSSLEAQRHFSHMAAAAPGDSVQPCWEDLVPVDTSVDEHCQDIDMYGDGAGVSVILPEPESTAPSPLFHAAQRTIQHAAAPVASMAGVTSKVAAKAYAQVSAVLGSNRKVQTAAAVLSTGPHQSQWLVLDQPSEKTRTIVVTAGGDVMLALRSRTGMVPFEGNRQAVISPVVQLEARHMFLQLTPVIMEAAHMGLRVRITGMGDGGSLASVLSLICCSHGLLGAAALEAVVFDAPPAIGEVAEDDWCDPQGCTQQDEQEMVDEIMSRGLLSQMGLSHGTIKSVIVGGAGRQQAASSQGQGSLASLLPSFLTAGLGLPGAQPAGAAGEPMPHNKVTLQRSDGKHMTLYKPLGTVVALSS